jgi:integrase
MAARQAGSILERGKGKWLIRVTLGEDLAGKRITKSKTVDGTRKDAQKALASLQLDVGSSRGTFAQLSQRWLAMRGTQVKETTLIRERFEIRKLNQVAPKLMAAQIDDILPSHLEELRSLLISSGGKDGGPLSPATVGIMMTTVGAIIGMAERDGVIIRNPFKLMKRAKVVKVESRFVEIDSVGKLLAEVSDGNAKDLVLLALAGGFRVGEMIALRWSDIDLENGTVRISKTLTRVDFNVWVEGSPKTPKSNRTVSLPQFAIDMLRERRKTVERMWIKAVARVPHADLYVFPSTVNPAKHTNPSTITTTIKRAFKRAGIEGSLHSLRHTHASVLLQTEPLPAVSQRLGHSSPRVTASIYSHALAGSDERATAAIDLALAGKLAPNSHTTDTE